jgi:glycosyl transferase family 1
MRIAIVTPYVASVLGNRVAFVLARTLARKHDVIVIADIVSAPLLAEVQGMIAPARLQVRGTPTRPPPSMARLMWLQLVRGTDRTIARQLRVLHAEAPLDAVVVFSDEGHWIGEYVGRWSVPDRPVTVLEVLELLDYPYLLRHERPHAGLRSLAAPVYPLLHGIEQRRLRSFDALVTISRWTTTLLGFLYGLTPSDEVVSYDDARFIPGPAPESSEAFIAVPTASLDSETIPWVERLHRDGIPLRLYGPRAAGQVPTAGFLPDAEMVDLLRQARATLFLFDYEAFGLIPVESLAVGTPVITRPKGGPYVEHRGNPNVHFVSTYPELLDSCRALLGQPKTDASVAACRASVDRYRPEAGAARLVDAIEAARRSRRRPG